MYICIYVHAYNATLSFNLIFKFIQFFRLCALAMTYLTNLQREFFRELETLFDVQITRHDVENRADLINRFTATATNETRLTILIFILRNIW